MLSESALVPETNVMRPAPTELTHELLVDEPFSFDRSRPTGHPDGVIPAGTAVAVIHAHADLCRIADASGLSVHVRRSSLRERRE